jgi:hypothetical protein
VDKVSTCMGKNSGEIGSMKITRLLPKSLAISFQENSIEKYETELEYYRNRVFTLEQLIQEGYDELTRLRGYNWK